MKRMRAVLTAAVLLAGFGTIAARAQAPAGTYEAPLDVRRTADAKFTAEPAVTKDGNAYRVTFAVSAATDVEVAVVDAKGPSTGSTGSPQAGSGQAKVVRHLAAGLLGPHAPAPFQKDSLKQELVWDGKDDAGMHPSSGASRTSKRPQIQALCYCFGSPA